MYPQMNREYWRQFHANIHLKTLKWTSGCPMESDSYSVQPSKRVQGVRSAIKPWMPMEHSNNGDIRRAVIQFSLTLNTDTIWNFGVNLKGSLMKEYCSLSLLLCKLFLKTANMWRVTVTTMLYLPLYKESTKPCIQVKLGWEGNYSLLLMVISLHSLIR